MRLSRSRGGKYAARSAAGSPRRARVRGRGRHVGRTVRHSVPLRRTLLRVGAWTLLLPVSVAAAAPQVPTLTQQPGADAVLTRTALLQGAATGSEPVASVTLVASHGWAVSTTPRKIATRGVPRPALRAYRAAEATMRVADPACGLTWSLLAGIGGVESDHGHAAAPALVVERGPMQFVPGTWQIVGVDGDGDGERDPQDIDDAALAAAAYLCAGGDDLSTSRGARAAVSSYNHSQRYAALVVDVAAAYERHIVDLPPLTGTAQMPTGAGVAVGVGDPGSGMLIGASDNVADGDTERAEPKHADRRATQREDADQPAARRDGNDRRRAPGTRRDQTDRPDDKPAPERPERRRPQRDAGDPTPPPTHETTKDPKKQPTDKPSTKPNRPGAGKGSGTVDEGTAPAEEFTGFVESCGKATFCLNDLVLVGSGAYGDLVDKQITVKAVRDGQTLVVEMVVEIVT